MLVGAYPFEDPADPRNFRRTIQVLSGCRNGDMRTLQGQEESVGLQLSILLSQPNPVRENQQRVSVHGLSVPRIAVGYLATAM